MTHRLTITHNEALDHGIRPMWPRKLEISSGDKVCTETGSVATFVSVSPNGVIWLCYDQVETEQQHQARVQVMVEIAAR